MDKILVVCLMKAMYIFILKLELKKGHGPHVYDNEVILTIVLEDLEIPSQNVKTPFPGVSVKTNLEWFFPLLLQFLKMAVIPLF